MDSVVSISLYLYTANGDDILGDVVSDTLDGRSPVTETEKIGTLILHRQKLAEGLDMLGR